jgi:signal peptidase I
MDNKWWFLDTVEPVVLAFAVFMMVYLFLFQPHRIDGSSMYPTFHDKEYILTDKISYKRVDPKRGDVIVFRAPKPMNDDFVKRIIGLPGETIMVQDGLVYINGKLLSEIYLPKDLRTKENDFLRNGVSYRIPTGYYMVFGDNRNGSSDSRQWGAIKRTSIIGRAFFRYWPLNAIKLIAHAQYAEVSPR